MIISASRRTDLPAFYSEWLARRFDAGFCTVPNPFNARQVARVSLRLEDVDAVVFWTRHAEPMLPLLDRLVERGYRALFHYTITGYGPPLEQRTPPLEVATATLERTAERLPSGAVVWRYDPIILGGALDPESHCTRFRRVAGALEGRVRRVVMSVVHPYRKTIRRLAPVLGGTLADPPAADPRLPELLGSLVEIARDAGMTLEACAQPEDWTCLGIEPTRCVDGRLLGDIYGGGWPETKDPGQRAACRCQPSKDIGMPDTCPFGCVYCYANRSDELARRRHEEHDPSSPALHGCHETMPTSAARQRTP